MRYKTGCTLFGLAVAATSAMLVAALEVSIAAMPSVAPVPMALGIDPASINRTFKGDRGAALPGASRVVLPTPQTPQPKLPDGCVAEADWQSNIYSDEVAGRCVG